MAKEATFTIYGGMDFEKKKLKISVTLVEEGEPTIKFDHAVSVGTRAEAAHKIAEYQATVAAYLAKKGM